MAGKEYDVAVIGSGPGGYVAAIRCAQLGMSVALIERYSTLGGTCLNVGCIPSKALLDSSEHFHNAEKTFATHGIKINKPQVDMGQMIKRKAEVVKQTVGGIDYLMGKNKIDVHHGHASFLSAHEVEIAGKKKSKLSAKRFIIATGSKPASLPGVTIDKKRVITSTEALEITTLPKSMVVIGGGVIGLELGSVYARLGTKVTVVEYTNAIIPTMDRALGKELQRSMKKLGVDFKLSHKVTAVKATAKSATVTADDPKGNKVEFKADYCLVAIGRRPYTDKLGLDKAGVKLDERGRVEVDGNLLTSASNIYAIGDVVKGPMLAHKAEEEGVYVAEHMAGQHPHMDHHLIPGVVYTWPEVAAVGSTEEQLKEKGVQYKVGTFPFKASGRARASMDTDGLVKILADAETDVVLGVHMVGPRCADIIAEAVLAMEYKSTAEDMARICYAHPTFTEAVKEAALDATGKRALHI